MTEKHQNWSGNYTYNAARWHWPETVEQVQELVASFTKLRVIGSRHSFNGIADTTADMISLEKLDHTVTIDETNKTATVAAGVRYGELALELHRAGYALHNMASLPHISIAGACATATHGSGDGNGNLATAVAAIEFIQADGQLVRLHRDQDGDTFQGAVVGLGALGVITRMTLDIQPAFQIQQDVYEHLPASALDSHFETITSSAYSVSLFTDWQSERINQVWLKQRLPEAMNAPGEFFGAAAAPGDRHPIAALSAEPCTPQRGLPGPWHERLPHFRLENTPSSGEELQTEYFVPRAHAVAAFKAIQQLHQEIGPLLMISEIRTIAADTLWLSPAYQQDSVGFHFTWIKNWPAVQQVLPKIEAALAPFAPRPHWGKLFTMPANQVQSQYTRLNDFRALAQSFDPHGKFRNAFLDAYIFT